MSNLEHLGWTPFFQCQLDLLDDPELQPLRVAVEHRSQYQLIGAAGAGWGELRGRLREAGDRPATGDWVAAGARSHNAYIVEHLLDRRSCLVRQAAGRRTDAQVLAANVDIVFVVTSANDDFNPRRLERYLAAVWESGANPVIVVNKTDLCADPQVYVDALESVAPYVPVVTMSAHDGQVSSITEHLGQGITAVLVGSSGVGKSTIVNHLLGDEIQATREIREDDAKGRHVTTRREMFVLPGGGVILDTPGMRELALWSSETAVGRTFSDVTDFAEDCRFDDCSHMQEPGCAVHAAVQRGELAEDRVRAFHKLEREAQHHELKRIAASRREMNSQGRMIAKLSRERKRIMGK